MTTSKKTSALGSLGRLLGFGGYQAVLQVPQALATNELCIDRIAEEIYCRETGKDWKRLPRQEQLLWLSRATSAVIGLRGFIGRR